MLAHSMSSERNHLAGSSVFSNRSYTSIVLTAASTSTSVRHCVITALFIVYADSLERGVGGTLMKLSNDWVDL